MTPRTNAAEGNCTDSRLNVTADFARILETELNYFKRLYENMDKSNEWQASVIKLAEEYVLSGDYREEYLRKKWKL